MHWVENTYTLGCVVTTRASSSVTRRWGAGTGAIARALIAAPEPTTGVALAKTVGVSQPRVSQVLQHLTAAGAVEATPDGYVGDAVVLLDLYRRRFRPSLYETSYWYSTRPLRHQATDITDAAQRAGARVAFSADLGPDLLAPWRHPTVAIVYTETAPVLMMQQLVPAEGRADASVIARWTRDPSLLTPAASWPVEVEGIPLTDPVQQWYDLLDLGGEDRREAADRLSDAIQRRSLSAPEPRNR